jgi:hypothetical protein
LCIFDSGNANFPENISCVVFTLWFLLNCLMLIESCVIWLIMLISLHVSQGCSG